MITLITSRFQDETPDLLLLQDFEQFCVHNSTWICKEGPLLFSPGMVSSRLYTALHFTARPLLKFHKLKGAVISLGLPYRNYLFSKNFPYFTFDCDLRVLWTYDVWQPRYKAVEELVRESKVNILLLSSFQATEHFKSLNIPDCIVHWVPETINTDTYQVKPWRERSVNILSFGRTYLKYHDRILKECITNNIIYNFQERNSSIDVATHGLKPFFLQFPTEEEFINGLSDTQICICFPRSITHPKLAGDVSTMTLRYLQAMASKCLVIGAAPFDIEKIFGYNPIVEVDWTNPVEQILSIINNPEDYQELIERNYLFTRDNLHYRNALAAIERLISEHTVTKQKG